MKGVGLDHITDLEMRSKNRESFGDQPGGGNSAELFSRLIGWRDNMLLTYISVVVADYKIILSLVNSTVESEQWTGADDILIASPEIWWKEMVSKPRGKGTDAEQLTDASDG